MADNLGFTPGSGANITTDQISSDSSHCQLIKIAYSADGERTPVTADADGLEVQIGKSVTLSTQPLAGQAWPVTDNGGNLSVDDGASSLTVDAPAATPVAVRLSTGAAFIDTIPVSDGASTLSVDDGAGSLTVDGTVTANQGTAAAVASGWPAKITDGTDTVGITTIGSEKALKTDVCNAETAPARVSIVRAIETDVHSSVSVAVSQTGATVWDPTAGTKFVLTDLFICPDTTSGYGRLTIFDGTNAAGNIIWDGYLDRDVHLNFQARPWISSTADNILKATTDADAAVILTYRGYQV